jgi:hypothetical protein
MVPKWVSHGHFGIILGLQSDGAGNKPEGKINRMVITKIEEARHMSNPHMK